MSKRIENILTGGKRNHDLEPPASKNEVAKLKANCSYVLPEEYLEFLLTHNGGNGELPVQPCWYEMWAADEVLEHNEIYQAANYLPDFFAIGSNQGGELIYIDYRNERQGNIVSIPLTPSDPEYANIIAADVYDFINSLGMPCNCT